MKPKPKTVGIFNFGAGATQCHAKKDKSALSQGAFIIRKVCEVAGIEVLDLCERWQKVDILLVSLYWWEHIYDVISLLASRGVQYERVKRREKPIIFVGGTLPSYNPAPIRELADLACIGDGELAAPEALGILIRGGSATDCVGIPGIYVSELDNKAVWQQHNDISSTLRWPFYNRARYANKSGVKVEQRWERRIEIARGCKNKCLYCGVSWTKKYRENDTEAIVKELIDTPGCIKSFAPDLMSHSGWLEIHQAYNQTDRFNQARDISMRTVLTQGFGKSRSYSTGIDGLSTRIRRALSKPLTDAEIVKVITLANSHMGSLGTYMILDLPGETLEDYHSWFNALKSADGQLKPSRTLSKIDISRGFSAERFYIIMTLNAFCPTPHTPLQWSGINWQDNLTDKYMDEIEILGPADDRRLKHKLLGRSHKALSRLLESVALRGTPELAPFIFAMAAQRKRVVGASGATQALMVAKKLKLDETVLWTMAEKSTDEKLPWEERVTPAFPRKTLLKSWLKYKKQMKL